MKLKSLLFTACLSLCAGTFAANVHTNAKAEGSDTQSVLKASGKSLTFPGYCQIEIINHSYTDVRVFGTFDDGAILDFNVYWNEPPHYISLFYNFYCHSGMFITIQAPYSTIYSGWTPVDSTIRIVPYLKKAKVEVEKRESN